MLVTQARAETQTPHGDAAPAYGAAPHGAAASDNPVAHGELVAIESEHGSGVFPPMDTNYFPSQLLWLAITFGLFYIVLQKAILPRIGGIIENRRDRIALDIEAATRMQADSDAARAAYEQELAEARDRSHRIAAEARESAKAAAEAQRAKIEADLDARLDAAQSRIAEIKQAALADVGEIAETATVAMLDAVAGISPAPDEVTSAVRAVRS